MSIFIVVQVALDTPAAAEEDEKAVASVASPKKLRARQTTAETKLSTAKPPRPVGRPTKSVAEVKASASNTVNSRSQAAAATAAAAELKSALATGSRRSSIATTANSVPSAPVVETNEEKKVRCTLWLELFNAGNHCG